MDDPHDDEAVSPVIGVVMIVAITVILAAVIGTFVLNLGGRLGANVQAGANVQFDNDQNEVHILYTSNQNAEYLNATTTAGGSSVTHGLCDVGAKVVYDTGGVQSTTGTVDADTTDGACSSNPPSSGPSLADGARVDVVVSGVQGEQSTVIVEKTERSL